MADDTQTNDALVAENEPVADAQATASEPAGVEEAADDAAAQEAQTFSVDDMRKVREEAKRYRLRLREVEEKAKAADKLQAELDKIRQAQMTEEERKAAELDAATKRAAELEAALEAERQQRQAIATDAALIAAMSKPEAGIVDAQAALKLLDRSALEYDDDGRPTADSVREAIDGLVEAYPFMKAQKRASVGEPSNPSRDAQKTPETDEQRRRRIMRDHGVSPFDVAAAQAQGGGVVIDPAKSLI